MSDARLDALSAVLTEGLASSRQGSYERRMPAKAALAALRAARSGLRELVESEPSAEALRTLGRFLASRLAGDPCDHSLRHTLSWAADFDPKRSAKVVKALQDAGGYCDCEVLANVV